MSIKLKINGKEEVFDKKTTVLNLIKDRGLHVDHIVVEYNHKIIPEGEYSRTLLKDDDNVEIVSFVGGG